MFTGLVEEIGSIKNITRLGGGIRISVSALKVTDELKIDDSVSINGVCQTVIDCSPNSFDVVAVEETLAKTSLNRLKSGTKVNLERAIRLSDRLGGHLVQGHVDCTGQIIAIKNLATAKELWLSIKPEFQKYVVPHGSIAIDGISLTVAKLEIGKAMLSIIPHTWDNTILRNKKVGDIINIEFDIIAKYVESIMSNRNLSAQNKSTLERFINQPY